MRVVLATHNAHKVSEFQAIIARVRPDIEVVAYDGPEPVEDGVTFAQNALIKARAAAAHTGLVALADRGLTDFDAALAETLHVFRRAGAAFVITYGARRARALGLA